MTLTYRGQKYDQQKVAGAFQQACNDLSRRFLRQVITAIHRKAPASAGAFYCPIHRWRHRGRTPEAG